jgi:uncharacterized protein (TIGR03790 family)
MSVTTAFAIGFDSGFCSSPCNATTSVDYFDSDSLEPYTDHALRPTMMLAAATTEQAQALVDRGVTADRTFPQTIDAWDYENGLDLSYVDNSGGTGLDYTEAPSANTAT